MKKGLLATTALIGAGVLGGSAALAAEAPEYKLSGAMNFQLYWVDADNQGLATVFNTTESTGTKATLERTGTNVQGWDTDATAQDHSWYFGIDSAEIVLNVSGAADNGLKYGFKIELDANTSGGLNADEARIQLSGSWGTLQLGDEDGAEDSMNYGGENVLGATGGFDGDQGDVLYRAGGDISLLQINGTGTTVTTSTLDTITGAGAPDSPGIAGDSGDHTKITYYTPRFSGFQFGASITPTPDMDGDEFKDDDDFENHVGLGANYSNSFGDVSVKLSAVYSASSSNDIAVEDIAAWQVGGIVGFSQFSLGANYIDNSDSGELVGSGIESSAWNVAAGYSAGALSLAVGYFEGTKELPAGLADSTYTHVALTADYKVAPGLVFYAEFNSVEDEIMGGARPELSNDTTYVIIGTNVSF